ncbi:MAG: hypothetical protein QNJ65_03450 [Xenococcaceae cyanobacterium MO_234.B1]|nr:hypothetical protein [Xenococcaceae cyanobacterium MO_234.B1]
MAIAKDRVRVATYIKKDLKTQAEKVAEQQGRSLSNYIEQLIKQDITKKKVKAS